MKTGTNNSVIEIVNKLLDRAIERRASDIHLESCKNGLRARLRIDGILYDCDEVAVEQMPQVISRIKVLARIDIAQKRVPQDGKFQFQRNDNCIDLRVSTFPTVFGQKM